MNEGARKKARLAELEWVLLNDWQGSNTLSFADWLEEQARGGLFEQEAKELIALYEEW